MRPRPISHGCSRVQDGEDVVITRAGTPDARIVPVDARSRPRVPGSVAGLIEIMADFVEPLPDNLLDAIEW